MRFLLLLCLFACGQEAPPVSEPSPVGEVPAPEPGERGDPSLEPAAGESGLEGGAQAEGVESEPDPPASESPDEGQYEGPEGETPRQAVERCRATASFERCLIATLDETPVRARERQLLIEAHEALGNEERMLDHMEAFLEDYPRDRRGNGYRIRLRESGRL
ncbi:MAG: hypothetical protein AAGF12_19230 [Myxococcota bacterium]